MKRKMLLIEVETSVTNRELKRSDSMLLFSVDRPVLDAKIIQIQVNTTRKGGKGDAEKK